MLYEAHAHAHAQADAVRPTMLMLSETSPNIVNLETQTMTKTARHLGGLSTGMLQLFRDGYFDCVTPQTPLGDKISTGLPEFLKNVYWTNVRYSHWHADRVPWLGVFQCPETFSKNEALSAVARKGSGQYPAVFYLTHDQDAQARGHAYLSPAVLDSMLSLTPHTDSHTCDTICVYSKPSKRRWGPTICRPVAPSKRPIYMAELNTYYMRRGCMPEGAHLIDVTSDFDADDDIDKIIMVCLKIAINLGRPWRVSVRHVRLVSRL